MSQQRLFTYRSLCSLTQKFAIFCLILSFAFGETTRGKLWGTEVLRLRTERETEKPQKSDGEEETIPSCSHGSRDSARRAAKRKKRLAPSPSFPRLQGAPALCTALTSRHHQPPANRAPFAQHSILSPLRC